MNRVRHIIAIVLSEIGPKWPPRHPRLRFALILTGLLVLTVLVTLPITLSGNTATPALTTQCTVSFSGVIDVTFATSSPQPVHITSVTVNAWATPGLGSSPDMTITRSVNITVPGTGSRNWRDGATAAVTPPPAVWNAGNAASGCSIVNWS